MTYRRIELPPWFLWETRTGEGPPLVLLHGLGASSVWWRRNIPALAQRHTVAAVDMVGFGRSRSFLEPSLPLSFAEITALLARYIEQELGAAVHLVGHSMGGHIAIRLAASRPDLIRSLTLVAATGIPFAADPLAHARKLARPPRTVWTFAPLLLRDLVRAGPTSMALASARLLLDDARDLLPFLRMPVLLIWGRDDPLVPLRYGEEMRSRIPRARFVVLENAGHVVMWDRPEEFNRELETFVDAVDGEFDFADNQGRARLFSWPVSGFAAGMCYRQAGASPSMVLVHGLGVSSRYFEPLARELFARGIDVVAPDLPGFGESPDAPPAGPATHATELLAWADAIGLGPAVWVGQSTGCDEVREIARRAPQRTRRAVFISPTWTRREHRFALLLGELVIDALREPPALVPIVVRDYWRAGLLRSFRTLLFHLRDGGRDDLPAGSAVIAGARDPLMDWPLLALLAGEKVQRIANAAHAVHFSNAPDVAELMDRDEREER